MLTETIHRKPETPYPVHVEIANILVNVILRQITEDSALTQEENA